MSSVGKISNVVHFLHGETKNFGNNNGHTMRIQSRNMVDQADKMDYIVSDLSHQLEKLRQSVVFTVELVLGVTTRETPIL